MKNSLFFDFSVIFSVQRTSLVLTSALSKLFYAKYISSWSLHTENGCLAETSRNKLFLNRTHINIFKVSFKTLKKSVFLDNLKFRLKKVLDAFFCFWDVWSELTESIFLNFRFQETFFWNYWTCNPSFLWNRTVRD